MTRWRRPRASQEKKVEEDIFVIFVIAHCALELGGMKDNLHLNVHRKVTKSPK